LPLSEHGRLLVLIGIEDRGCQLVAYLSSERDE